MKVIPRAISVSVTFGAALGFFVPTAAAAYGGPGSVITGIGAFLAALVALAAALLGFLWFPMKKLVRSIQGDRAEREAEAGSGPDEASPE